MKVYKKFCSLTGVPLHHKTDAVYSDDAENSDHAMFKAIDKSKKAMGFQQYGDRKGISHGEYSAHEQRFSDSPRSTLRKEGPYIGKYAMRSAKSSHGDQFSVEMQGLVYDTRDNYEISRSLTAGFSSAASFETNTVWKTQGDKRRYGKYKLKPGEINQIDFRNLDKKLKSVRPPKGRARRKEATKEDNELILKLLMNKPTIWDRSALNKSKD